MKLGTFNKQPGERLSNSIVYDDALDEGDSVETLVSCTVEPAGLEVTGMLVDGSRVRVFAEGGADGQVYKITVVVSTQGGERFEDELLCRVKEL